MVRKTDVGCLVSAGISLAGCAGATVGPDDGGAEAAADGIRSYEPAPFMLSPGRQGRAREQYPLPSNTTRLRS